jgi:hypothetical protein
MTGAPWPLDGFDRPGPVLGAVPRVGRGCASLLSREVSAHIAMIANGTRNWIKMSNLIVVAALESGSVANPGH